MTLADAIAKAHIHNEARLAAGISVPLQLDADAASLLDPWNRFCSFHGCRNIGIRPQVVAAFIRAEASQRAEPHKIALTLSAIELLHDRHGLSNPVATAVVRAELERILKIEAPRSWPKAEQLMFASLPPEIRAIIARREREREIALRRAQNAAAELRQSAAAEIKPATKPNEESNNHDHQKTQ